MTGEATDGIQGVSGEITDCVEFDRVFRRLEDNLSLFELEVGGVSIWERTRAAISIDLLASTGLTSELHVRPTNAKQYLKALSLLFRNLTSRNPFLASSTELFFFGHPRRKLIDGDWWDIYCDPVHERTDFDSLHVEPPWQFEHRRPPRTQNLRYLDLITVPSLALRKAGLVSYDPTPSERRVIGRLEARIESVFGVAIDVETRFRREIETRRVQKPLYDRFLGRVDPELAVIVAYSGHETFIEACHDAGIPVAELQHGQISPYSYQHSFPGDRTKSTYPDYLLTFGDFWNDVVEYPIADDRVISVGYPYLETEVDRYTDTATGDDIVFISSPEAGPRLSKIAVEIASRPAIDASIVYKLHPDEYDSWERNYPWLVDAPISVIDSSEPGLYDCFATALVQVGVGSTALYEGLAFGLHTYLVDLPTVQWMAPLLNEGEATLVESPDELAAELAEQRRSRESYERYFEPNAVENVTNTLDRLLAEATLADDR